VQFAHPKITTQHQPK